MYPLCTSSNNLNSSPEFHSIIQSNWIECSDMNP